MECQLFASLQRNSFIKKLLSNILVVVLLSIHVFCIHYVGQRIQISKESMRMIGFPTFLFFSSSLSSCVTDDDAQQAIFGLKIELVFNNKKKTILEFLENNNKNTSTKYKIYKKEAYFIMALRSESKRYFVIWADSYATHATNPIPLLLTTEMHKKAWQKNYK